MTQQSESVCLRSNEAERLLEEILPMAMWVSCAYQHDRRADDFTHCCDWGPLIDRMLAIVGGTTRKKKRVCPELVSLRSQLASCRERCERAESDMREAIRLLTMNDGKDYFLDAMELLGKHCGITPPDLSGMKTVPWTEYFRDAAASPPGESAEGRE